MEGKAGEYPDSKMPAPAQKGPGKEGLVRDVEEARQRTEQAR